jgi:O-antigen biosynthesis protein
MRPVLYTCITGGRDSVPQVPPFFDRLLDFVLYVDPAEVDPGTDIRPWTTRPLLWQHPTDPVRTARWHKHHPMDCFPHRTNSIWLDATHWPTTDISWFPDWFLQGVDIACFPHFARSCLVEEMDEIIRVNTDDPETVRSQMRRYEDEGFFNSPADRFLFDTTVVVRRHNPPIRRLSDLWWGEIERGSRRDQLSFTYCLWKLEMRCETIVPGHSRHPIQPHRRKGSPYFGWKSHPVREWTP